MGSGYVEARDISEYKVQLMQENIERTDAINIRAAVKDATVVDEESIPQSRHCTCGCAVLRSWRHRKEAGY